MDNITRHIGYDLLGPVIHRWLLALHQYIQYLDDGDTAFLFCARAGVRVQKLYQIFQRGFPCNCNTDPDIFWISRFSVTKGVYQKDPARSLELITREYQNRPLPELIEGLLPPSPRSVRCPRFFEKRPGSSCDINFPDWLTAKSRLSKTPCVLILKNAQAPLNPILPGCSPENPELC